MPLDLTIHLACAGFEVEVICGSDQYAPVDGEPPPDPSLQGIRIRRIPALMRGNIHRAKWVRQLWFYAALLPLLLLRRPPDVIVAQTNPPLAVILAAAVARIPEKRACKCGAALAHAIITDRTLVPETTRQKLPPDFQSAEKALEHGMIDMVVPRRELKETVARLLALHPLGE